MELSEDSKSRLARLALVLDLVRRAVAEIL